MGVRDRVYALDVGWVRFRVAPRSDPLYFGEIVGLSWQEIGFTPGFGAKITGSENLLPSIP